MSEPNALASGFPRQNGHSKPAASAVGSIYAAALDLAGRERGGTAEDVADHSRGLLIMNQGPNGDDDGNGYTNLDEWLQGYAAQVESQAK